MKPAIPSKKDMLEIVRTLKTLYPEDSIEIMNEDAITTTLETTAHAIKYLRNTTTNEEDLTAIAAASILRYTVLNHPLTDGNKKLGAAAAALTLIMNGYHANEALLACLSLLTAMNKTTLQETINKIRENLNKTNTPPNTNPLKETIKKIKPHWDTLRKYDKNKATLKDICKTPT